MTSNNTEIHFLYDNRVFISFDIYSRPTQGVPTEVITFCTKNTKTRRHFSKSVKFMDLGFFLFFFFFARRREKLLAVQCFDIWILFVYVYDVLLLQSWNLMKFDDELESSDLMENENSNTGPLYQLEATARKVLLFRSEKKCYSVRLVNTTRRVNSTK